MSTKADFYLGRGANAQWLGSVAWDGYPWKIPPSVTNARSDQEYLDAVKEFLKTRLDGLVGSDLSQHWPWPWDDSSKTTYSYTRDRGKFLVSHFGGPWSDPLEHAGYEFPTRPKQEMPDMSYRKSSVIGAKSGIVLVLSER